MISWTRVLIGLSVLSAVLFTEGANSQSLVVALGDSNAAGFGVTPQQAFPAQLERLLRTTGYDVQVFNAGVSGDTTQGMLARLDSAVRQGTRLVIVQGGYNDRRRGSSPAAIMANIEAILSRLSARQIRAVLCGFFDPTWDSIGEAIARKYGSVFVPGGMCYDSSYRGSDGLHMTAAGHQVVAARLLPLVQTLLVPATQAPRAAALPARATRRASRANPAGP